MFFKLILTLCLVYLSSNGNASKMSKEEAMKYMQKFGYADPGRSGNRDFSKAIARFQRFFHLKVTGKMDEETDKEMEKPRCGNSDEVDDTGRRAIAFRTGSKWRKTRLTYRFLRNSGDVSVATMKATFVRAFRFWSNVTPLRFSEVTSGRSDFTIVFARGEHGDGAAFDGPGRVLAHAFLPENGRVHFDEDERYTVNGASGIDLLAVAVHEIGHALGLYHSNVRGAIMWPSYNGYDPNLRLHRDDIQGIQSLYGSGTDGGGTGTGETCMDKNRSCESWAGRGFCEGRFENYMKENCAKSCDNCPEPCMDKNRNCQRWSGRGFCQGIYENYMKENCAKSCRHCS